MSGSATPDLSTFQCQRCGACCCWKGFVHVSATEVDKIAEFLNMDVYEFSNKHTALLPQRCGLTLLEAPDGSCEWYDHENRLCRINPVKPQQCKDFPYKWRFNGWEKLCAAAQKL